MYVVLTLFSVCSENISKQARLDVDLMKTIVICMRLASFIEHVIGDQSLQGLTSSILLCNAFVKYRKTFCHSEELMATY